MAVVPTWGTESSMTTTSSLVGADPALSPTVKSMHSATGAASLRGSSAAQASALRLAVLRVAEESRMSGEGRAEVEGEKGGGMPDGVGCAAQGVRCAGEDGRGASCGVPCTGAAAARPGASGVAFGALPRPKKPLMEACFIAACYVQDKTGSSCRQRKR